MKNKNNLRSLGNEQFHGWSYSEDAAAKSRRVRHYRHFRVSMQFGAAGKLRRSLIKSELPCGAGPRCKPAVQESTAGFDGASHCIREQDKTVRLSCGNEAMNSSMDEIVREIAKVFSGAANTLVEYTVAGCGHAPDFLPKSGRIP